MAAKPPSQAALAKALGLSQPSITKLKGLGMPVHSEAAARAWRAKRLNIAQRKRAPAGKARPASSSSAETRRDKARALREEYDAQIAEIELRKAQNTLVDIERVRSEFGKKVAAVCADLTQIGGRVAPVLLGQTDQRKVKALVDAEVRKAIEHFKGASR